METIEFKAFSLGRIVQQKPFLIPSCLNAFTFTCTLIGEMCAPRTQQIIIIFLHTMVFEFFSAYLMSYKESGGNYPWIITDADRTVTTFLLPEEYWTSAGAFL